MSFSSDWIHVIQHRGFPFDSDWEKYSLPLGNGYMGVNLFGRTDTERIQLSEKTLGVKGPYGIGGITNFAEIYLDIQYEEPEAYRRELSLDEGVARVSYRYEGVNYSSEYFANYPSRVIVVTLKTDQPGKVSFLLRMAKFLSKTLKPTPEGYLLASPSSSPEQYHQGQYYQTVGCTFDQSMIQENFMDLLKAAEILKIKDSFLDTVRAQLPRLDAIQVGTSGQIKEYREEQRYGEIGDPRHRHISHLCALYPGTLILHHENH